MNKLQCQLKDLGKSFEKFKRQDELKREIIKELSKSFVRQGFSPWMAINLAEEKYKQQHQ